MLSLIGCDYDAGETAKLCTNKSCCTAFPTEGVWLTTAHCFNKGDNIGILFHDEYGQLPITIQYINFNKDIVVFAVGNDLDFLEWTLCEAIPPIGTITAITEVPQYNARMGKIVIPVASDTGIDSNMVYLNLTAFPGHSGGPVIYNRSDCVIGMLRGTLPSDNSYAINVHELKDVL